MHRALAAVVLVSVAAPLAVAGSWQRPAYSWSAPYYYPVRVYEECYPPIYIYQAVSPWAAPTPAPPSQQSPEPPLNRKVEMPSADKPIARPGPTIFELRAEKSAPIARTTDRIRVGFWNQSGKDLMLTVAGQTHRLARDRAMTLQVPRGFVWQIDQQPARSEPIADDQASHEIVIR